MEKVSESLMFLLILFGISFFAGRVFAHAGGDTSSNLSPTAVEELLSSGSIVLIDVRETHEFEREHIEEAISLPLSRFDASQLRRLSQGKPVVFYCRSGRRSGLLLRQVKESGALDDVAGRSSSPSSSSTPTVAHMAGGINSWKSQGLARLSSAGCTVACGPCRVAR